MSAERPAYRVRRPPGPPAGALPPISVGRLLAASFSTWAETAGWVIPIALILATPVAVLVYSAHPHSRMIYRFMPGPMLLAAVVGLLLTPVELIVIARVVVRHLDEEELGLGDLIGAAARSYFPALALLFVVSLVCGAFTITLVGVILAVYLLDAWAAAVPAMAVERLGPVRSLRRSWELTLGVRGEVFAAAVIILVIAFVAAAATVFLTGLLVPTDGREWIQDGLAKAEALNAFALAIVRSLLTTATAVLYHQLRVAKEGRGSARFGRIPG